MISRGAGRGEPLVKTFDHFGEAKPPLKILVLALLFKVVFTAMINYVLLYGYRDISNC